MLQVPWIQRARGENGPCFFPPAVPLFWPLGSAPSLTWTGARPRRGAPPSRPPSGSFTRPVSASGHSRYGGNDPVPLRSSHPTLPSPHLGCPPAPAQKAKPCLHPWRPGLNFTQMRPFRFPQRVLLCRTHSNVVSAKTSVQRPSCLLLPPCEGSVSCRALALPDSLPELWGGGKTAVHRLHPSLAPLPPSLPASASSPPGHCSTCCHLLPSLHL